MVASSGSTVDVPPVARTNDLREVVQCSRGSRPVESKLEKLRAHVLDQGFRWINHNGQDSPTEHKAHRLEVLMMHGQLDVHRDCGGGQVSVTLARYGNNLGTMKRDSDKKVGQAEAQNEDRQYTRIAKSR